MNEPEIGSHDDSQSMKESLIEPELAVLNHSKDKVSRAVIMLLGNH